MGYDRTDWQGATAWIAQLTAGLPALRPISPPAPPTASGQFKSKSCIAEYSITQVEVNVSRFLY